MRKWIVIVLVALMIVPSVMPVGAQDPAVVERLEEYGANLPQGYGVITVEDSVVRISEGGVFLLDVRQPDEYEAGHIDNSVSVPLRELGTNLELLPADGTPIIVICAAGFRAMLGGAALQALGYENVLIMKGGYNAWTGENLPTTIEATEGVAGDVPAFDPVVIEAVATMLADLPEGWGGIRPDGLAAELAENPPILIDVRSDAEWESGYIAGAQHIWINEFMASQDQWPEDKDANIVVYCASAYRGNIAAVMLRLMGYTNVRNLSGGINSWISAGLPLEGAPEAMAADFDLLTAATDYVASMPPTFNAIQVDSVMEMVANGESFTFVDLRREDEFGEGFIPGAINMPLESLTDHLDMLPDLDTTLVVYCASGHRSVLGLVALNMLGYENATSMLGGVRGWTEAGNELTNEYVGPDMMGMPDIDPALFEAVDAYIKSVPQGYWVVRADALQTELIESAPVLIDVRTSGEYENGFITSAVNIPLADLLVMFDAWPEDTSANMVFYGSGSHRGALALALAQMLGYENARSLVGGTGAWTGAGFELGQ